MYVIYLYPLYPNDKLYIFIQYLRILLMLQAYFQLALWRYSEFIQFSVVYF